MTDTLLMVDLQHHSTSYGLLCVFHGSILEVRELRLTPSRVSTDTVFHGATPLRRVSVHLPLIPARSRAPRTRRGAQIQMALLINTPYRHLVLLITLESSARINCIDSQLGKCWNSLYSTWSTISCLTAKKSHVMLAFITEPYLYLAGSETRPDVGLRNRIFPA